MLEQYSEAIPGIG